MIFPHPIQNHIICCLAQQHIATIQDIYTTIPGTDSISLKHFYKIINELLDTHVLSKHKKQLSLNRRRKEELQQLVGLFEKTEWNLSLPVGETQEFTAGSIAEMDNIWGDILLELNKMYDYTEQVYIYHCHNQYMIGMEVTDTQYRKHRIETPGHPALRFLIGNDTYLDHLGMERHHSFGLDSFYHQDHPFLREGYNFNIVGDYIIEFYYPQICSQTFQIFFESIEHIEKLNTTLFANVFHMRVPCTLRLRHDPHHCKKAKETMDVLYVDYKNH